MTPAVACILGDPDLLHPLVDGNVRCHVVAHPGAAVRSSRLVDGIVDWPLDAPDEDVAERMLGVARSQPDPPVVLCANDRAMLLVSRFRHVLEPAFRLAHGPSELIEATADKIRFHALATTAGLPVPASRAIDPSSTVAPPGDLDFPVIVKPMLRAQSRWSTMVDAKVLRLPDRATAERWWPRLGAMEEPLLFQQVIPGPETAIESHHVYVRDDGRILGEFTGRKIRTLPREYGTSTALETTAADDVATMGRQTIEGLGITGPAKIDVKRDLEGRLWLLEVNMRFTLWCHLGAAAGVNLPAIAVADKCGLPPPPDQSARAGVTWVSPRDLLAAPAWGVSRRDWIRFWRTADVRWGLRHDDRLWPMRFATSRAAHLVAARVKVRPGTQRQRAELEQGARR